MTSTGSVCLKDPEASAWPRGIDWTNYLAEISATETISSSSWAIEGGDSADSPTPATVLTKASETIVTGSLKTQVKLAAGTPGQKYRLVNSIITSSGVHDDRSIYVKVQEL